MPDFWKPPNLSRTLPCKNSLRYLKQSPHLAVRTFPDLLYATTTQVAVDTFDRYFLDATQPVVLKLITPFSWIDRKTATCLKPWHAWWDEYQARVLERVYKRVPGEIPEAATCFREDNQHKEEVYRFLDQQQKVMRTLYSSVHAVQTTPFSKETPSLS